jgi:hypothetical protein
MINSNSLSGRPPLAEGKRTKKIDVRFTEEEYRQIEEMESELGVSKTNLVRMRVLDKAGWIIVNAKTLLKEVDLIAVELARAGNNINQLAHHANVLKLQGAIDKMLVTRYADLLEEYIQLQYKLEVSFRKIIRGMGSTA